MGRYRPDTTSPAPMSPPLAHAFLALADDDAFVDQRSRPRVLAAAVAAAALALGGPLSYVALPRPDASSPLRSHPVAALSSKFSLSPDEEGS
jgi:hypothetical protein